MLINGKKISQLGLQFRGQTLIHYDEWFNRDLMLDFVNAMSEKQIRFAFFYRFLFTMLKEKEIIDCSFDDWMDEADIGQEEMTDLIKIINESPRIALKKKIKETESR